jgi:hypothetical protein
VKHRRAFPLWPWTEFQLVPLSSVVHGRSHRCQWVPAEIKNGRLLPSIAPSVSSTDGIVSSLNSGSGFGRERAIYPELFELNKAESRNGGPRSADIGEMRHLHGIHCPSKRRSASSSSSSSTSLHVNITPCGPIISSGLVSESTAGTIASRTSLCASNSESLIFFGGTCDRLSASLDVMLAALGSSRMSMDGSLAETALSCAWRRSTLLLSGPQTCRC